LVLSVERMHVNITTVMLQAKRFLLAVDPSGG
jgi:hypothetical protein